MLSKLHLRTTPTQFLKRPTMPTSSQGARPWQLMILSRNILCFETLSHEAYSFGLKWVSIRRRTGQGTRHTPAYLAVDGGHDNPQFDWSVVATPPSDAG